MGPLPGPGDPLLASGQQSARPGPGSDATAPSAVSIPEAAGWTAANIKRFEDELACMAVVLASRQMHPVPAEVVEALRSMRFNDAWRCLQGCRAPHVRSPMGLLNYKIKHQLENQSPLMVALPGRAAAASCPAAAGTPPTVCHVAVSSQPPTGEALRPAVAPVACPRPSAETAEPAAKRTRGAASDATEAWQAGDEPPPRHCCPGCGERVPVGSRGFFTRDGVYEINWRRHACAASWTVCSVPTGFGCGGLLNAWYPQNEHQEIIPGPDHIGQPHPQQPFPRLPHCIGCGNVYEALLLAPTDDINKRALHVVCDRCNTSAFGTMTIEGHFLHVACVGRSWAPPHHRGSVASSTASVVEDSPPEEPRAGAISQHALTFL